MLVVDRTVFAQLQADHTGIDFMELSADLVRAQRYQSTPSILDSEATSKGLSPTSLGFSPPAYEDIFGSKNSDLPPSYSEVSLMFRTHRHKEENIEMSGVSAKDTCEDSFRIEIEEDPSTSLRNGVTESAI